MASVVMFRSFAFASAPPLHFGSGLEKRPLLHSTRPYKSYFVISLLAPWHFCLDFSRFEFYSLLACIIVYSLKCLAIIFHLKMYIVHYALKIVSHFSIFRFFTFAVCGFPFLCFCFFSVFHFCGFAVLRFCGLFTFHHNEKTTHSSQISIPSARSSFNNNDFMFWISRQAFGGVERNVCTSPLSIC